MKPNEYRWTDAERAALHGALKDLAKREARVQKMADKMQRGMDTGRRWDLAQASYFYSRHHGLSRLDALVGAWECFWARRP